MRYVLGFAGIPAEIYDDVQKENRRFAESVEFFIDRMPNPFAGYSQKNINYFLDKFYKKIAADEKKALQDTGFAIIYILKDEGSTQNFRDAFFPHTLLVPVEWNPGALYDKNARGEAKNRLIPLLQSAASEARAALRVLHDEVTSRSSSTPLLLPLKNFTSDALVPELRRLGESLPEAASKDGVLVEHVQRLRYVHPPQRIPGKERDCFVDDKSIEFHPPGNARHAFSRAGGDHPYQCLLSGRRRLGAPYDPLFHYDCAKGPKGNLKGCFATCHEAPSDLEGKPHLNIAPNDHVRGF